MSSDLIRPCADGEGAGEKKGFNGTVGKMLAAVLLGAAEMEQETRRERQAAGIAVVKS